MAGTGTLTKRIINLSNLDPTYKLVGGLTASEGYFTVAMRKKDLETSAITNGVLNRVYPNGDTDLF